MVAVESPIAGGITSGVSIEFLKKNNIGCILQYQHPPTENIEM